MHRVQIAKSAKKDLNKVDSRYRKRLTAAIFFIGQDPLIGKKLEDKHGNRYSLRVGVYRIVYEIYKKEILVIIVRIGHRQGVYKK